RRLQLRWNRNGPEILPVDRYLDLSAFGDDPPRRLLPRGEPDDERGVAESLHTGTGDERLAEPRRRPEVDLEPGEHHLDFAELVADGIEEVGEGVVEVAGVVPVEDDALGVGVGVADFAPVRDGPIHSETVPPPGPWQERCHNAGHGSRRQRGATHHRGGGGGGEGGSEGQARARPRRADDSGSWSGRAGRLRRWGGLWDHDGFRRARHDPDRPFGGLPAPGESAAEPRRRGG